MLYLRNDLVKADPPAGAPPPAAPAATPSPAAPADPSGQSMQYQPCSVGGAAGNCLRAGGNGHDTHKVGGAIERKHAEWQASQGAGAPQTETATPAESSTPEQVQESQQQAAESTRALDPKATQGTISTDPKNYPEDSHPLDHYNVASAHEKMGGGNDSSKQIAEGHRQIARQRSEKMSPEEHQDLAEQLRTAGLHDDADHHEKTAGEQKQLAEEKAAVAGGVPAMMTNDMRRRLQEQGHSPEDIKKMTPQDAWSKLHGSDEDKVGMQYEHAAPGGKTRTVKKEETGEEWNSRVRAKGAENEAARQSENQKQDDRQKKIQSDRRQRLSQSAADRDAAIGGEFDQMMGETEGDAEKIDQLDESAKKVEKVGEEVESAAARKDEDPHSHAVEEWEAGNAQAKEDYESKVEEHKAKTDEKHKADVSAAKEKHEKDVEAHKAKTDADHDKKSKEWEDKNKEREAWNQLSEEHRQAKPVRPGPGPKASDYDLPANGEAYDKAKASHTEKKELYEAKKHAHHAEGIALNKQRPPLPGKKPAHPGYKKGAPKLKEPKHPGYTKGAPEKPKSKPRPKAEDFDMKKPSSDSEKAEHSAYTQQAKTARENIQSHMDNNPDLSDEDREKLQAAHAALEAHEGSERMPTKEQSAEAKKMHSVAGKHGKESYQSPEDKAAAKQAEKTATKPADEARAPETDIEKIQHADHKAKAQQMRDNIQSHMDAIHSDENLSPEQKSSQLERLQQIHKTLEAHTQLEHLPTREQQSEMKELTKLASEHGKKPFEEGTEDSPKKASAPKSSGSGKDWAAAFGRGAAVGSRIAESMRTGSGAASGTMAGVNAAAGGVVSAGDSLLRKPARGAMEQAKKQAELDTAAEQAAKKKEHKASMEEATVKGLYLNLDTDLDMLKAVTPPNAGSVTRSDKRAQRKMKESYAKHPVGAIEGAGAGMVDDPDVGDRWHHSEEDSVDAELDEEVRNQDEEKEVSKADAVGILKSLQTAATEDLERYKHNPTEVVFMRDVLGYNEQDIRKGLAHITGRNRQRFHEWMLARMYNSVDSMLGNVNLG